MARNYTIAVDPFNGLAVSAVTSNVISIRDAFDWSFSWRTTSGATSVLTLQLNNQPGGPGNTLSENEWSNWSGKYGLSAPVPSSQASIVFPPLATRYIRFLRQVAGAPSQTSFSVNVNILVR